MSRLDDDMASCSQRIMRLEQLLSGCSSKVQIQDAQGYLYLVPGMPGGFNPPDPNPFQILVDITGSGAKIGVVNSSQLFGSATDSTTAIAISGLLSSDAPLSTDSGWKSISGAVKFVFRDRKMQGFRRGAEQRFMLVRNIPRSVYCLKSSDAAQMNRDLEGASDGRK